MFRKTLFALARLRLVQFIVLGGLIFAFAPAASVSGHISLQRRYLDALEAAEAMKTQVNKLAPAQAAEVEQRAMEDEVLFREALRLGLDRDDLLIRQHLIQKMLLLAEDLGGATRAPTEADLRAFFAGHAATYAQPGSTHFLHVYAASAEALAPLQLDDGATTPPGAGEAFALPRDVHKTDPELAATFGPAFVQAVATTPPGHWSAPLQSSLGWHRVKVLERTQTHAATFDEVRGRLPLDFAVERRKAAVKAFLSRAFERYRFDVDGKTVPTFTPEGRLGARSEASAEDG
jgi:peptidyl-prolyl cis-trans isomerase C